MAEFDDSDDVARLKKWWANNGRGLMAGIALGLVIVAGWYAWNWYQDRQARQAAGLYAQVSAALAGNKMTADAKQAIRTLKNDYTGTPYAVAAAMALGRYRIERDSPGKATDQFAWAVENARNSGMTALARARLARSLWAQGQADKALATLSEADQAPGYASLYAEIRGDILAAQEKTRAAHAAYETALADRSRYAPTARLQRKLEWTAPPSNASDDEGGGESQPAAKSDSTSTSAS